MEDSKIIIIDESEEINNVSLETLLKGEKGDTGDTGAKRR